MLTPLTTADAKDAAAFFQLGQLRLRQQRVADAVDAFEQATKLDATKPDYFSQLGIAVSVKMQQANFLATPMLASKMKKALEKSVALDPNHLPGLIGLARFSVNAPTIAGGSLEKAKAYAERVQKLDPFLGELELGNVAEHGADFAAALTHYEAASQLQPKNARVHVSSALMLAKLGRKDEARQRLQTALALNPSSESAKNALAELAAPAAEKD